MTSSQTAKVMAPKLLMLNISRLKNRARYRFGQVSMDHQ